MHLHEKGYDFLPQLLSEEFASLKTALNAATKAERSCARADKDSWAAEKERIERQLAQTRTRLERTQREAREREVLAKAKKDEREKRKEGKGAWHMKKGLFSLPLVMELTEVDDRCPKRPLVAIQIRFSRVDRRKDRCQTSYGEEASQDVIQGEEV
jgi:hypothetical protein